MPITLDQRPLSPAEREGLQGSTTRIWLLGLPGVVARYLLGFVLLMALGMSAMGILDAVTRKSADFSLMQWQPGPWAIPLFVLLFWGPIVFLPAWFATRPLRAELRRHRQRTCDLAAGHACVARVEAARFISYMCDAGEHLLFDLDSRRGLLLDGARLRYDRALFGLPELEEPEEDEDGDDIPEAALGQTPFPNSDFELHWLPHSGRMLQIEVRGTTVAPLRVLLDNELALPEAAVFARDPEREVLLIDRGFDAVLAGARVAS